MIVWLLALFAQHAPDPAAALVAPLIAELQPALEPAELAWAQQAFADGLAQKSSAARAWSAAAAGASLRGHDKLAAWAALHAAEVGWYPGALTNVGVALVQLGRLEPAQVFCARALELDPRCARALETQAAIAWARKDNAGARGLIERALRIRPDDPELCYAGAILARKCGDPAAAQQHIRHACELRPGDRTIAQAQAALDPGAKAAPSKPEPPDALARLVAETQARLDRVHELATTFEEGIYELQLARRYSLDRTRPPFCKSDIDAKIATQRKVIADAEAGFRNFRGAAGYANGKWNFAVECCVLACIQVEGDAEQKWWMVDAETRVFARALRTNPLRLYAALDSGAICANVNPGEKAFCYYGLAGGQYAQLLCMEKEHGFGRAYWEAHERKNEEMEACRALREGRDACERAAIRRFCEALSAKFPGLLASVQSTVNIASGEFKRALELEMLQTQTVVSDARDFTSRALRILKPIGDAKIEAQTKPWAPGSVVEMTRTYFTTWFGGMVTTRREVLAQAKMDLIQAEADLEHYVAAAAMWVHDCNEGGKLQPRTLSEEIDALLAAFEAAGKFEASSEVECDVEMPGISLELKAPEEGLRPDVQVKLGEEHGLKLIDQVSGTRRGVGLEESEAEGLAGKAEISIVRESRAGGAPEYSASVEGKLGVGLKEHEMGMACYFASVGAEVDLRALFENYAEAMKN